MGRWGERNFQCDTAWDDVIVTIYKPILERMVEGLKSPELFEADEPYAELVPAGLQVLTALTQGLGLFLLPEPRELDLRAVREAYLSAWDRTIGGLTDGKPYPERRAVVVETFDAAIAEVASWFDLDTGEKVAKPKPREQPGPRARPKPRPKPSGAKKTGPKRAARSKPRRGR